MRYTLDWASDSWRVTSSLGEIAISRAYYREYGDALRALLALLGVSV